jgi:carbamoylphosphate synthase large subunit
MKLPFLSRDSEDKPKAESPQLEQPSIDAAVQQLQRWRELAQTKEGQRQLAAEMYQMAAVLALLSMEEDELEQLLREVEDQQPPQENKPSRQENEPSKPENEPSQAEIEIPRGEPQPITPKQGRARLRDLVGV